MSAWTSALPFFPARELACRHCGVIKLDLDFAAMLPTLRLTWDKPLTPTSVCRCPAHNKSVGGHPNSLHMTENAKWKTSGTMAADIWWSKWHTEEKLRFARHAHKMGFRVGLHDTFCHIDLGRKLEISPRPFVYGSWSKPFTVEDVI
jgi:hypothetical protein